MQLVDWVWGHVARLVTRSQDYLREAAAIAPVRAPGQSTVEYALVGALVVIAAAGAMTLLGDQVSAVFGHIKDTLAGAVH
jgi:Flp pilus assembly pilin Flp